MSSFAAENNGEKDYEQKQHEHEKTTAFYQGGEPQDGQGGFRVQDGGQPFYRDHGRQSVRGGDVGHSRLGKAQGAFQSELRFRRNGQGDAGRVGLADFGVQQPQRLHRHALHARPFHLLCGDDGAQL